MKLYNADTLYESDKSLQKSAEMPQESENSESTESIFVSAVWIYYNELATDNPQKSAYVEKIDGIFKTLYEKNYNTAFVQVRAFADAFYRSKYYPATPYLCKGDVTFDALEIICTAANRYGISVHAWINPYRVSYDTDTEIKSSMLKTPSGVFYDPAAESSRALIINGVTELINNYDIDGVHIDDYFYPADIGTADAESYKAYRDSGGTLELPAWRRSNVNHLMKSIYTTLKSTDESLIFSVSPGADIQKNYDTYYADVYTWCKTSGFADWIVPQIYFGYENSNMPFSETLSSWEELVQNESVKLIVGLPGYKVGKEDDFAGSGRSEFINNGMSVIEKQIAEVGARSSCSGFSIYSYSSIA